MSKGSHKLKGFLSSWLEKPIDGYLTKTWLKPHPEDRGKAICGVCPGSTHNRKREFSVKEGFTAVTQHASGAKHKKYFEETQRDPNHNRFRSLII